MKIRPVEAELFLADGQTDMTKCFKTKARNLLVTIEDGTSSLARKVWNQ